MFIEKGFGASLSSKNFVATSKQPIEDDPGKMFFIFFQTRATL
jgi:hypothetical protein